MSLRLSIIRRSITQIYKIFFYDARSPRLWWPQTGSNRVNAYISVTASIFGNINPEAFPLYLKIYLVVYLFLGAIWYIFMYRKLRAINIAELTPAKLVSETSTIKLLALSGEVFFIIGLAVLFTLLFPNAWEYYRLGFWAMAITLVGVLIYSVLHYWPKSAFLKISGS